MHLLLQKRRIITTAIIAVVTTGITIAALVAVPLINQLHTQAEQMASHVVDTKTTSVQAIFDQHQKLAAQTASRTEIARRLAAYVNGELPLSALQSYIRPRLEDAIFSIDNLAALVRYDASGNEVVRVGPMANELPGSIPLLKTVDIKPYTQTTGEESRPLLHTFSPIYAEGERVGYDLLLFSLAPLQRVFQSVEGSSICLLNSDGMKRVALSAETNALAIMPPNSCLAPQESRERLAQDGFFRAVDEDGHRVLAFLRSLDGYDWDVHVRARITQVFGNVIQEIIVTILVVILLSALAGVVVWRALKPIVHAMAEQTEKIARSTEELRLVYQVFEHTHEAIVITDATFRIIRANPAFIDITGADEGALDQQRIKAFFATPDEHDPLPESLHQRLLAENSWQGEVWLKGADGNASPNLLTISPVLNRRRQVLQFIMTFNDITERVKVEKQMRRLAHFDELTGLPNRTALESHLQQSIQKAREEGGFFALMFLDLDKFKPVNDTYGHHVGDELLRHVAKRLKNCLRSNDVVGRMGGDEFVVITAPLQNEDDAKAVAGKIVGVLNDAFQVEGHYVEIGVSVGIALYPKSGKTAEVLLEQADSAMYAVKTSGRNNVAVASSEAS